MNRPRDTGKLTRLRRCGTPREVAVAVAYVRGNHEDHRAGWRVSPPGHAQASLACRVTRAATDPYSSASRDHGVTLPEARAWLLARTRAGPTPRPGG